MRQYVLFFSVLLTMTISGGLIASADVASDFSRLEDTWGVAISPDGNTLALGCVYQEQKAVCIAPLVGDIEPTIYPGADEHELINFYWASNSHVVMITDSTEQVEFTSGLATVRINRALSFNARTGQTAMLLKDYRGFSNTTNIVSLLEGQEDKVLMSLRRLRTEADAGLSRARQLDTGLEYYSFVVDLDSGGSRQQRGRASDVVDILYDRDGEMLVRTIFDESSADFELQDGDKQAIYEDTDVEIQPLSVTALTSDGEDLLVWSDGVSVSGHERGSWRMSMDNGSMSRINAGGFEIRGHSPVIDRYTNRAVGFWYNDDLAGQHLTDPELADFQGKIATALDGRRVKLESWSRDRSQLVVSAEQIGRPSEYYLFSTGTGELSLIGAASEMAAGRTLGEVSSVSYQAQDGLNIPAYLTLPAGKSRADGPFPTILLPHGGPDASDDGSYDWWSQAYAAAGYAVLQPNFRGSSRYGARFREAGFGEFGGKMVTDVLDGVTWMEAEGLATPGGACVIGASYGGYSALMAPLLDAARVKCAVSVNGVTDPIAQIGQYRQSASRNSSLISYWEQYMGNLYSDDNLHATITPAERLGDYRRPVLLIHGDQDTRVPFEQFEGFRSRAGSASWLTTHVMKGQDHFLGTRGARQAVLEQSLSFLAEHHPAN